MFLSYRYESKGKQWAKNRPTLPVGLDPCYAVPQVKNGPKTIPGLSDAKQPTEPKTSSKKKKKKLKDAIAANLSSQLGKLDIARTEKATANGRPIEPTGTDPAKRIRNLKKKLRDINALKLKIETGELANPEKDQLEKISRKGEIEAEIEELELELGDD